MNHTVDQDADEDMEEHSQEHAQDISEMKSKPTFTVDIKRDNQTLGFTCSFNVASGSSGADESYSTYRLSMSFHFREIALRLVICLLITYPLFYENARTCRAIRCHIR